MVVVVAVVEDWAVVVRVVILGDICSVDVIGFGGGSAVLIVTGLFLMLGSMGAFLIEVLVGSVCFPFFFLLYWARTGLFANTKYMSWLSKYPTSNQSPFRQTTGYENS